MVKQIEIINMKVLLIGMEPIILVYGAGAIGCTIYRWLKPFHDNLILLARAKTAERIRTLGLSLYEDKSQKLNMVSEVNIIESIDELEEEPEIIIITVKNYSLEDVCQSIKKKFPESNSLIVSLQNGVKNLEEVFLQLTGRRIREAI